MIWLETENVFINLSIVRKIETTKGFKYEGEEAYQVHFHFSDDDFANIDFTPKQYAQFKATIKAHLNEKQNILIPFHKES